MAQRRKFTPAAFEDSSTSMMCIDSHECNETDCYPSVGISVNGQKIRLALYQAEMVCRSILNALESMYYMEMDKFEIVGYRNDRYVTPRVRVHKVKKNRKK